MQRQSANIGFFLFLCVIAMSLITPALANGSLFAGQGRALLASQPTEVGAPRNTGSLFPSAAIGMRAPTTPRIANRVAARAATPRHAQPLAPNASQIDQLRYLIQTAESRRDGYDAVQHGAKVKPGKRPTRMTIGEIYKWIDDTPKQPHAIGRYQFIPKTLRRLVKQLRLPPNTRFTPQVQDRLANILLTEAGLNQLQAGRISRKAFMKNLAKIWAGFPLPNGRSYYHGYAGNKASMSWASFNREMTRIFPG